MKSMLADGAYQVTTPSLCAGFVVRGGEVSRFECAPILWRKLAYWAGLAVYVCPPPDRHI